VPQPEKYLEPNKLELSELDVARLAKYLDKSRLLTTRLDIRPPAYHFVAVKLQVRIVPGEKRVTVEADILARLNRFLNPLTGGNDGKGWPFGRNLFAGDIYQCLYGAPNVQFIRNLELYAARSNGEIHSSPVDVIDVVDHGVIASGKHIIEFV
jgi:hypothetical protein